MSLRISRISRTSLVTLVALGGCRGPARDNPIALTTAPESTTEIEIGDEFTLAPDSAVEIPKADLRVTFLDVLDDSRCPIDVTCIWAGDATVVVKTVQGGRPERIWHLHTAGEPMGPREAKLDGYVLVLMGLRPVPRVGEKIPEDRYRATFRLDPEP